MQPTWVTVTGQLYLKGRAHKAHKAHKAHQAYKEHKAALLATNQIFVWQ
jgi:hypothetical protein